MNNEQDPFSGLTIIEELKPTAPDEDPFAGLSISPEEKRFQEIQAEKEKYTFFNTFRPDAINARGGNILASRGVSDEDVKAYAYHYGIDYDLARKIATLRGAAPPLAEINSLEELAQAAAGKLNIATGNIAGWIGKKTYTDDPNMRAFIDDIGELADGRAGLAEVGIGFLLPGAGVAKLAKAGKAAQLAASAATGAGYGLTNSKEGQEIMGIVTGAIGGTVAGTAGLAVQRLFSRRGKPLNVDPQTQKNIDEAMKSYKTITGTDLTEETAKAYSKVKASNDKMRDSIIDSKAIDEDDAAIILEQQVSSDTKALIVDSLRERFIKQLPEEEQAAARKMIAEKKSFDALDEATSDLKVAEEVIRLKKDEFAQELAERNPELKFIKAEVETRPLRATNDEIIETMKRGGPENLKREYDTWTAGNLARGQLEKANVRVDPNADALGKGIINFATDRMFGFKVMDERYGGDILKDFYQVNTNYNLFTTYKQAAGKEVSDIFKLAKKSGLHKQRAMEDFYRRVENKQPLSPDEQKLADAMQGYFERQRQFFNSAKGDGYSPMNIPYRPDFVAPQMMVRPVDYVIRIRKKLEEVKSKLPDIETMDTETFMRNTNVVPELQELKQGVSLIANSPVTNGRELFKAFAEVTSKGGSDPRLYKLASTTLPRKEAIPDFLREKNIFRLMTNYAEGTGRNLYLREPLSRMVDKAKTLDTIGAKDEADFVRRFVQDNLGIRQKSMARFGNQARIAYAESMDNLLRQVIKDDERRESVLAGLRFLPELAANLQYNIYPNVLGMNPRAHMTQLTQVLFKTAPEIGGAYGYQSTMKSTLNALASLATKQGRKEFYGQVKALGLEPSGYVREAKEGLAEGLEASIGFSVPAKVIRSLADAFMWSYGKMDTLNRAITLDMSRRLVQDIKVGNPSALKALSKMPISVRRQVKASQGNDVAQLKAIASHLNAATQFNYNRASMSEIGITLGPMFSTFTKWPLAISGDILADMRTKGVFGAVPRTLEKYVAIYLLAQTMDNVTYALLENENIPYTPGEFFSNKIKTLSDRARRTLGSGGFTSMTPVTSLKAFVPATRKPGEPPEKSLFTPPIYDTVYSDVISPLFNLEWDELQKGGIRAAETFAPGAFGPRFLLKDMRLYFGDGAKPESYEEGLEFYTE